MNPTVAHFIFILLKFYYFTWNAKRLAVAQVRAIAEFLVKSVASSVLSEIALGYENVSVCIMLVSAIKRSQIIASAETADLIGINTHRNTFTKYDCPRVRLISRKNPPVPVREVILSYHRIYGCEQFRHCFCYQCC